MNNDEDIDGYVYEDGDLNNSHTYLLPALHSALAQIDSSDKRLFDLGCRNGSIGAAVTQKGWDVAGVDVSSKGIEYANRIHPQLKLETGSAYDDLVGKYGSFPVVISLEVVEHLYDPRTYAKVVYDLLEPGGTAIISTPISRLLEEPCSVAVRQDGQVFYRPVGARPYQVLVNPDPDDPASRSRFSDTSV